ncbi:enoyl-CoA hydratase/isomerase family protein [Longivirga aurantiaca]|uniref:Enoyl-CoA hydratase/isomerase family protein n=1 Tax=Longivirga aurantiaca TaxID=1837743 RepID=A0ABW1T3J6_9ACTN
MAEFDPAIREADETRLDEPSDFAFLTWTVQDRIATVVMSRPPVNAVNQRMYRELHRLFTQVDRFLVGSSVVVLLADGKHFCGGNDLGEFATMTSDNARERMYHAREAFYAIMDCPLPTVAAVQGVATGTGIGIASSCDVVIAADDARLGLTEVKVGVMGGPRHLARMLPQHIVRYMFLTGELMAAPEMARLGGILEAVPADKLRERAHEIAALMARHDPLVLRTAKLAMNEVEEMDLRVGYEREQSRTLELADRPERKEALQRFFDKGA